MFGLPWLSPTLIGAVGIALLASFAGGWAAHKYDGIALAKAQSETAQAQTALAGYRASVAASVAKANADALQQQTALSARADALQAQLTQTQKDSDARSKALLAKLAAAKPGDTRDLGPSALSYYSSLRNGASTPAPNHPGNP